MWYSSRLKDTLIYLILTVDFPCKYTQHHSSEGRLFSLHIYIITEGFLEVAIERCPEWDLNPRPLNSVKTLKPTELSDHEFDSLSEPTLYSYSNFISLFSVHVSFWFCLNINHRKSQQSQERYKRSQSDISR